MGERLFDKLVSDAFGGDALAQVGFQSVIVSLEALYFLKKIGAYEEFKASLDSGVRAFVNDAFISFEMTYERFPNKY